MYINIVYIHTLNNACQDYVGAGLRQSSDDFKEP